MPIIRLETNLDKSLIPADLSVEFCMLIAVVLGKSEERVSVTVESGLDMCRGPSKDPTLTVHLWAIDVFTEENNPRYAVKIRAFLHQHLPSIPDNRIILVMHPISGYYGQ